MKHIILIVIVFVLQLPLLSQDTIDGCCITLADPASPSLTWSNDSISFAFTPSEYFWEISISNSTSRSITCMWDEALFIINDLSSKIIFDYTTLIQKNDPLAPGIIAPGTKIKRSIIPLDNVGVYATNPVYTKKMIKRTGERIVSLFVPVQAGSHRTEYKFVFKINLCE